MFTILRKINGNRTPTEHESPTLGDTKSQVFKDAMSLLTESNNVHNCMDSGMDAKPWINGKSKPVEEWVERFKKAFEVVDPDPQELIDLVSELSPGMFDKANARFASHFGQVEDAFLRDTGQTIIWLIPKGTPIDSQFKDIPRQSVETLHTTLDFIEADEMKFAVFNSKALWDGYNSAELFGGVATEISSVELQHIYHDDMAMPQEAVLKASRRGDRTMEQVIGVLAYGNSEEPDPTTGNVPVTVMTYEFIYQGDEVYVTNRHGKTVDSIR
ncbi:hypothetical protein pEaSNUABM10_00023 [Erwinia phage pEa_SNUABM_10]|nr:hypothetical protein pEaSNUABM10_00023 [Erwinia phage pEa_SNUABM_10]